MDEVRQQFNRHSDTDLYNVVTDLLEQTETDFSVTGRYLEVDTEYNRRKSNTEGIRINKEMMNLFRQWEQSTDEQERARLQAEIESYL
jgi:hypothetical protein